MKAGRIRRCRNCNAKTHHRLWKNGMRCPVCGQATGFADSSHGGLTIREIEALRRVSPQ